MPYIMISSGKSTGSYFAGELEDLFEKAYFSHSMGHRKPDTSGFELIIRENGLDPKQTLFVDDAFINVEGAIKTGLKGLYLPPGFFITDILLVNFR